MLDLQDIGYRVDRGVASPADIRALFDEVTRLYGSPLPPEVLALERAQTAQAQAEREARNSLAAIGAAQTEAGVAAARLAEAKAATDAAQQAVAVKAAADRAASDKAIAASLVAQKNATAKALKDQLNG